MTEIVSATDRVSMYPSIFKCS